MRVSWTAKRSNQSILKEINSEYALEGLMLKLKLLCFDIRCEQLTHWRASLAAQLVKNLLAMQETWVGSLDWEDPLEKGKVTHWKKS